MSGLRRIGGVPNLYAIIDETVTDGGGLPVTIMGPNAPKKTY